jgi:hypothetical protein
VLSDAHSRLPVDACYITTDHLATLPHVDVLLASPPCPTLRRHEDLCDMPTVPFTASCHIISQLATSQGFLSYIITSIPGATRIPELRASLGEPILARAHDLGSTARRNTLVWTNICSPPSFNTTIALPSPSPSMSVLFFPRLASTLPSQPHHDFMTVSPQNFRQTLPLTPSGFTRPAMVEECFSIEACGLLRPLISVLSRWVALLMSSAPTPSPMRPVVLPLGGPLTLTHAVGLRLVCRLPLMLTALSSEPLPSTTRGCLIRVLLRT